MCDVLLMGKDVVGWCWRLVRRCGSCHPRCRGCRWRLRVPLSLADNSWRHLTDNAGWVMVLRPDVGFLSLSDGDDEQTDINQKRKN